MNKYDELKTFLKLCDRNYDLVGLNELNITTEILRLVKIISNNQYVKSHNGELFVATKVNGCFEWDTQNKKLRYSLKEIINELKKSETIEELTSKIAFCVL